MAPACLVTMSLMPGADGGRDCDARVHADERRRVSRMLYPHTRISLMSLREISERLTRTVRRIRGTPAALAVSSKSPLRIPVGGSNRPEKLNGSSSFAGRSNSHSFDQSEPRCLIEIAASIPVLPRFSSSTQT